MQQQTLNAIPLRVVTAGSNGSATGTATTSIPGGIQGFLYAIHIKPNATGWAATTDITITEVGGPARTILTLTNKSDAAAHYPVRVAEVGATGSALPTYTLMPFDAAQFSVAIAQGNAKDPALEVWFYLMR